MRVVLYVRVSTQEQAKEGYSIQEQIERLTKYCEAMGWIVVKVYTDAGFSGATMDRPALNQMIRDIKEGKLDKVVVYKLDRLSRSQLDTLYLIEKVFLTNNTDFVSMNENFDTSTPFGRAMIGILAVFAQLEREQIKERMAMGREARAKEGKYGGSWNVPIGYDYIPEKDALVINEYERMQVLQLFDMLLQGMPYSQMARKMKEAGYSHKHGTWSEKTIRNVIRSRTYLGELKYHDEWYKGSHTPIISEDTHERAFRIAEERRLAHQQNKRTGLVQSYLGGLLFCSRGGGKYTKVTSSPTKSGNRHEYYSCCSRHKRTPSMVKDPNCKNKNWKKAELDNLVFAEIKKLATDPHHFDKIKAEIIEDSRPQIISAEIGKLDSQMSKLMDLYSLGHISFDMVETKIHEINETKQKLESELAVLQESAKENLSRDEAIKAVKSFGDILERGDFNEIRYIITTLIDRIDLDGDDITIRWNFN